LESERLLLPLLVPLGDTLVDFSSFRFVVAVVAVVGGAGEVVVVAGADLLVPESGLLVCFTRWSPSSVANR
jgi:hypothetical protein